MTSPPSPKPAAVARARSDAATAGDLLGAAAPALWGVWSTGSLTSDLAQAPAWAWLDTVGRRAWTTSFHDVALGAGWSEPRYRQVLYVSALKQTRPLPFILAATAELLHALRGEPMPDGGMTGPAEDDVRWRVSWLRTAFYGGDAKAMAEAIGAGRTTLHFAVDPETYPDRRVTDSLFASLVGAGFRAEWLRTGEGEVRTDGVRYRLPLSGLDDARDPIDPDRAGRPAG